MWLDPQERQQKALKRVDKILVLVSHNGVDRLEYPNLVGWNNVQFSEGSGLKPKEPGDLTTSWLRSKSVWRLLHILNVMRANIQLRTLMTLRGVYYELPLQFNNQGEVDRLIKIAVAMLKVILGIFCLF